MSLPSLNIAFFGSSLVSSYWNGAATYYRGIVKALSELGHRVTFYEPDAYDRQNHRDMADPEWARVVVYAANRHEAGRCLLAASEADVLIKASGVGVLDDWLEKEVLENRGDHGRKPLRIFWDVDAPETLARLRRDHGDPFRQLIPRYDAILTYGGGPPVVEAYSALGARLCEPIYNALDPETHHPAEPDPRFRATLGFLGNRLPDREGRVHEFFFKPVAAMPEANFILGGSGWHEHVPRFDNLKYLGHIYTGDHNAFNCTPLAVLNINRDSMARIGFSPPTRVFEAAGAGACLISDRWEGLTEFLRPDEEVITADSGEQVVTRLRELDMETARRIGAAARRRVLAEHTYRQRARQFEALLEDRFPAHFGRRQRQTAEARR